MIFFQWTWCKTFLIAFRRFIADTLYKAMRWAFYVCPHCHRQRLLGNKSSFCHLGQFVGGPVIIRTKYKLTFSTALSSFLHCQQYHLSASNGITLVPWLDFHDCCPRLILHRGQQRELVCPLIKMCPGLRLLFILLMALPLLLWVVKSGPSTLSTICWIFRNWG